MVSKGKSGSMIAGSKRPVASHIPIAFLTLQVSLPKSQNSYLAYDSAFPILSYISMIFLFLSRTMTSITRKRAAIPSRAGTTAMIQVGAATQLDSTSQKTVPKKLRQHPPLQKLGSEHPVLIFLNQLIIISATRATYIFVIFHLFTLLPSLIPYFLSFLLHCCSQAKFYSNIQIKAMINIFQYLKQGTSLNRNSHNSNQQLEDHIIAKTRTINHTYQSTGKFHNSDSEDQAEPDTLDQKELQHHSLKTERLNHEFIKGHHIRVEGIDVPKALSNFTKIIQKYQLRDSLINGIGELGYQRPTAVQMQVIPALIEKRNVIVTAPTGTGKTLAFLIPLLQNLQPSKKITAIIMVPLQELATQIFEVLKKLGKGSNITFQCLSKITAEEKQKIQNKKSPGFNILVATPITFLKFFSDKKVLLKNVEYIVLDQCDKCFEESFFEQMKSFLDLFVKYHPTYALFSATIQNAVEEILKIYLHDCVRIQVGGKNKVLDKIEQSIQYCTNELGKLIYVKNLITEGKLVPPVLMFVQEKVRAKQLYFQLNKYLKQQLHQGKRIQVLSADKSWEERQKIVREFDAGKYWILVTTDILARGIDFTNVNLVINYDFPNSMLTYIHRVGRTGRAERTGTAVTLFTDEDKPLVRSLANLLKTSGCKLPDWIAEMPKANKQLRKKLEKYPVRRLPVGRAEGKDKGWQKEIQVLEKRWQKLKKKQIQKAEKEKKADDNDDGWVQVGPQDE